MYNGKHKSFKSVLWRVLKHEFCSDLSEEQAADYALELLRRLKMPFAFEDCPAFLNIKNYRAKIPNDLIIINGMRLYVGELYALTTYDTTPDFITDENSIQYYLSQPERVWQPIKYTGNIYQSSYHCSGNAGELYETDVTYRLNNNYIYLSVESGILQLSYRKLMVDEEGYPLIPEDQSFEDALYYYIIKEHLFGLMIMGKVSEGAYNKIDQEYTWAIGQATNALKLAGMDHWEATMNGIRRLIQMQNFSDWGYKELHKREQIKKK